MGQMPHLDTVIGPLNFSPPPSHAFRLRQGHETDLYHVQQPHSSFKDVGKTNGRIRCRMQPDLSAPWSSAEASSLAIVVYHDDSLHFSFGLRS
jgi:hypothetical protein